jgi:molybdopterin synthase sulfur carrier subunit
MEISVLFFAALRDLTGVSERQLTLQESDSLTVQQVREHLVTLYPSLHFEGVRVAVNEDFVTDEVIVRSGDVVAFIPPVSGG